MWPTVRSVTLIGHQLSQLMMECNLPWCGQLDTKPSHKQSCCLHPTSTVPVLYLPSPSVHVGAIACWAWRTVPCIDSTSSQGSTGVPCQRHQKSKLTKKVLATRHQRKPSMQKSLRHHHVHIAAECVASPLQHQRKWCQQPPIQKIALSAFGNSTRMKRQARCRSARVDLDPQVCC